MMLKLQSNDDGGVAVTLGRSSQSLTKEEYGELKELMEVYEEAVENGKDDGVMYSDGVLSKFKIMKKPEPDPAKKKTDTTAALDE